MLVVLQNGADTLEDILAVSHKTKYTLTIGYLRYAPWHVHKGLKRYVYSKSCTWMFIVTLFIIAQTWKQPRYPSIGE